MIRIECHEQAAVITETFLPTECHGSLQEVDISELKSGFHAKALCGSSLKAESLGLIPILRLIYTIIPRRSISNVYILRVHFRAVSGAVPGGRNLRIMFFFCFLAKGRWRLYLIESDF